ncbi:MAG TPA: hypothetical protein VEY92_08595 [Pseudoxanthomonas sp.]|nr:hypothetical protein [Pseudoxanthomonas sp.]
MLQCIRGAAIAIALAAPYAYAADIPLTPEQESKANELGMIDSPVAFLTACGLSLRPPPPEAADEISKASEAERELMEVTMALSAMGCAGMIAGVVETVATDPVYRLPGIGRICTDPKATIKSVFRSMEDIAIKEPHALHEAGFTTSKFILYTLSKTSACQ